MPAADECWIRAVISQFAASTWSHDMHSRSIRIFAGAMLVAATWAVRVPAQDGWADLIQGAPHGANAIGLIDVGSLREQGEKNPSTAEILETLKGALSDGVNRGAFVAELTPGNLEPVWEAGLVITNKFPTAEKLAKATGGYVDEIEGMKVVWTPKNAFLAVQGDDRVVAYRPANRKALAKLLRDKKANGPHALSPYLQSVVKRGTVKTPVTIGLDLTDAVSPAALKQQLATLSSVAGSEMSVDQIAKLMMDLEGLTFTVTADEKATATLRIDFKSSPQALAKVGKAMIIEVFGRGGAELPEMADWKLVVSGDSMMLSGRIGKFSLSHVLSLFNTPFAIGTMQSYASSSDGAPDLSDSQKMALASKKYFTSVNKIVENVRGFSAQTLGQRGLWCDREGRKIDQLPILGVDPDMLNYGAAVSGLLRGSGLEIRNVNMQAATMTDKSMVTAGGGGYGYGYGWGGGGWGLPSAGYNAGAAARDTANLQVKSQQNLAAQGAYLEAMGKIDQITPQVRRAMTQKYNIEF
jgi:hypothetical protein